MAKAQFRVEVMKNGLPTILRSVDRRMTRRIREFAHEVRDTAKAICPVGKDRRNHKAGTLRDSIEAVQTGRTEWEVGTDVEYGPHVEFGTHKMAARPYLGPAVDQVERRWGTGMAAEMEKALEEGKVE